MAEIRTRALCTYAVMSVLAPRAAQAAESDVHPLKHDVTLDVVVISVSGAWLFGSELYKSLAGPGPCRWCDRDEKGIDSLNALDANVRAKVLWSQPTIANTMSDVGARFLAPTTALGFTALAAAHDRSSRYIATDLLLVSEATMVALSLQQAAKLTARRPRPYAHAGEPETIAGDTNANVSFFSGHTTFAFALAASAGTVTTLRGYRWAPITWAVGAPIALTTGYLRIAADKHYFTDVLVGALVGTGIGIGVPLLFHGRESGGGAATASGLVSPLRSDPSSLGVFCWSGAF